MNWKFLKHLLQIFCNHHRIHIKIEEPYPLVLLSSSGETFNILCIGIQLDVILENRIVLNLGWNSVSTSWFRVLTVLCVLRCTVLYCTVLYCTWLRVSTVLCVLCCTVLYCTVLYLVESIDSAPPLVELGEDHPVEAEHPTYGQENRDGGGQLHLLQ